MNDAELPDPAAEVVDAKQKVHFGPGETVVLVLVVLLGTAVAVFLGALAVALIRILWRLG